MDRADPVEKLSNLHGALVSLGRSLGLPITALQEGETAHRLEVDQEVPCNSLLNLAFENIREAVRYWGNSLTLRFSSEYGVRPFHVVDSQIVEAAFADFVADLRAARDGETLRLRLSIDKAQFVQHLTPPIAETNVVVFTFLPNLLRAIAGSFSEIEEIFFPKIQSRCICLLLEGDVALHGPYLSVFGPSRYSAEVQKKPSARLAARISKVWEIRKDQVSWVDFETQLTPFHLMLESEGQVDPFLRANVERAFYALTVVHLADSVRRLNGDHVATFSGLTRAQILIRRAEATAPSNVDSLSRAFMWAYSEKAADKLPFLRSVATSYLTENRELNYSALGENADRIWEAARANYAAFIRGFVTRHFEKLKEVDDYVRQTSQQVGEQISEVSKSLVTTMLATVGVIVGGFVAYALNKEASPKLLSIGLKIYGGYVVLFPLLYFLLFHSLTHYAITIHDFNKRMRDFGLVLQLPELSKKFSGVIKPRKVHFWATLIFSFVIYAALAAACLRFSGRLLDLLR
jgi:hypothetical protein